MALRHGLEDKDMLVTRMRDYGVEAVALQTITITIIPAGYGGSEKRKTSNEGRTHSRALLRRPTTLC